MRTFLPWLLALTFCLGAGLGPRAAGAEGIDGPQTVYQSAEFGYVFFWNADEWTVTEQSAQPGVDQVSLINTAGDLAFTVYGYTAPGTTPESCINDGLTQMANTPGVTRVENLEYLGTEPEVFAWTELSGASGARADYFVAYTADTGPTAFVFEDSCYQMGASDALIWTSVRQTAASFNAGSNLQPTPSLSLVLPRWTWTADTLEDFGLSASSTSDSAIIPFLDGSEKGALTNLPFGSCAGPTTVVVVGEGLGYGNFVIDPNAFSLTNGARPTGVTWLSPPFPPTDSAALASGDKAVLRLDFAESASLQFTDTSGVSYPLGSAGGCGGGGSMPIRVPLE
ncbi:MAG: hypothetical protein QM692_05900 [Thermomicrobiales bacterium]